MSREKRIGTRVDAEFDAYITVDDVVTPVKTLNLSLRGALLRGCEDCPIGTLCELHLPLSPGVRIVVEGKIVRAQGQDAAMRFTDIDELSFTFLHRLVQLNAHEADDIDDELMQVFRKM
ncbi:PilZ domain-containing protein [Pseudodesulfovibrio tunisiensis]|uniref:PilZ domain-containing protein n=1 Tax=Pseudodesulfovibrio tunisiensis TaxID=463192 RepID=UPI001FB55EB9|nr:PilZ domain-containing protein [Pseudodesulfovibrio tunisiensis]